MMMSPSANTCKWPSRYPGIRIHRERPTNTRNSKPLFHRGFLICTDVLNENKWCQKSFRPGDLSD
jgi:hypothetical protein